MSWMRSRDAGYDPVCSKNGQEALAWLRRNPAPSVVLCDLFMPTMNGWDFVRHLRQDARWRTVPLVVLTAIERYWGYPADRVLRKPVGTMQLLRALIDATNGLTAEAQGGETGAAAQIRRSRARDLIGRVTGATRLGRHEMEHACFDYV